MSGGGASRGDGDRGGDDRVLILGRGGGRKSRINLSII